jgi:tetratricopeptide (TPR) repeat protein
MYLRLCLASSLLLAGLAGCFPHAQEYYEEGLREYRAGNYDAAAGMFKASLDINPEKQEAAYYLARCARRRAEQRFADGFYPGAVRELDQAIQYYDQAIEAYPGYTAAIEEKVAALELKGRYDDALETSIWAKENAGRTVEQIVNVAREYEERGDVDRALIVLRQAIAVEPDNAKGHAELGRFFMRLQRYDDALRALEHAYELDPAEPGVANDLAMLRGMVR